MEDSDGADPDLLHSPYWYDALQLASLDSVVSDTNTTSGPFPPLRRHSMYEYPPTYQWNASSPPDLAEPSKENFSEEQSLIDINETPDAHTSDPFDSSQYETGGDRFHSNSGTTGTPLIETPEGFSAGSFPYASPLPPAFWESHVSHGDGTSPDMQFPQDWENFVPTTKAKEACFPDIGLARSVGISNFDPPMMEASTAWSSSFSELVDRRSRPTSSNVEISSPGGPNRPIATANKEAGSHHCKTCGSTFEDCFKLRRHARTHNRPHRCDKNGCEMTFAFKKDLTRHLKTRHGTERDFRCPAQNCKYRKRGFKRKDNLVRHMKSAHSDVADEPVSTEGQNS